MNIKEEEMQSLLSFLLGRCLDCTSAFCMQGPTKSSGIPRVTHVRHSRQRSVSLSQSDSLVSMRASSCLGQPHRQAVTAAHKPTWTRGLDSGRIVGHFLASVCVEATANCCRIICQLSRPCVRHNCNHMPRRIYVPPGLELHWCWWGLKTWYRVAL